MALEILSPDTMVAGSKEARPMLRFNKNGIITINKGAAALLEVAESDSIQFAVDGKEVFCRKCGKKDKGFSIRKKFSGSYDSLIIQSTGICNRIREAAAIDMRNYGALLSATAQRLEDGNEWYPLISSINKKHE